MFQLDKFVQAWPKYAGLTHVSKEAVLQYVDEAGLLDYLARVAADNLKQQTTAKSKLEEGFKKELLAVVPLSEAKVSWEEEGRLEEHDGCSYYYYGPRQDVSNEFDTRYELAVSFSNKDYWLNLTVEAYHDCDVGDDKVLFEPHADVDLDQNLTDAYSKEAVQAVLDCIYARMDETTLCFLRGDCLLPSVLED